MEISVFYPQIFAKRQFGGGYVPGILRIKSLNSEFQILDAKFEGIRSEEATILGIRLGNTSPKAAIFWEGDTEKL